MFVKDTFEVKNVLVLGNGFDLHHNMKTRYSDYIEFIQELENRNKFIASGNGTGLHSLDDIIGDETKLRPSCLAEYVNRGFSKESIQKLWFTLKNNFCDILQDITKK